MTSSGAVARPEARVAYLGPEGTFTEAAARQLRTISVVELEPISDVETIAAGIESGQIEWGVVPIENSVHGYVLPTLDELVFVNESVLVREEVVLDVSFTLFRNATHRAADAQRVYSHSHALAQCRNTIERLGLEAIETKSTADACRLVAGDDASALCIAAPHAGLLYGLVGEATTVEDRQGGRTRFYLLGRRLAAQSADDSYRTALVLTPARDRPGILLDMLRPFAERSLNMSSLMSRPLRSGLGLYCFIIVVDSHVGEPRFQAALSDLLDAGVRVKNLGSYLAWQSAPLLAGAHADVPPGSVGSGDAEAVQSRALAPPRDADA